MARLEDYLFSKEFLFEGEQADEYKKRKEREAKSEKRKFDSAVNRRRNADSYASYGSKSDAEDKARRAMKPHEDESGGQSKYVYARDAALRNQRRHQ